MGSHLVLAATAFASYCNTVPTPEGGTHEAGLRMALKGLQGLCELTGNKARRSPPMTS
jgi:DNA gyrase/topoisomerase IV subunit B